jgi:hypothetical protein
VGPFSTRISAQGWARIGRELPGFTVRSTNGRLLAFQHIEICENTPGVYVDAPSRTPMSKWNGTELVRCVGR